MSTASLSIPVSDSFSPLASGEIVVGHIHIPATVRDFDSFLHWAHSGNYPERGQVSFLDGEIWIDLSMEELITHNLVKSEFAFAIMSILRESSLGVFVGDRMLLTNAAVKLATEPDGMVLTPETLRSGRVQTVPGKQHGCVELRGSPDLLLEIVSDSSRRKDCVTLRQLYFEAGVGEYWLADVRGEAPSFQILIRSTTDFEAVSDADWQTSPLLGRQFRIVTREDPNSPARFAVEWRTIP